MAKIKRPKIYHLCSLGTLGGYGGKKGEWSTAKKLKKIKDAGFDGFVGTHLYGDPGRGGRFGFGLRLYH